MKKYHNYYLIVVVLFSAYFLQACASLEDCCDDDPVVIQDTIKLPPLVIEDTSSVRKDYRLTVQIGAFHDKIYADRFYTESREKLNSRDVVTRLDPRDGLYKITIGVFDNVETANAFLETIISRGFRDAFVREVR